jgi:hypothetical protein
VLVGILVEAPAGEQQHPAFAAAVDHEQQQPLALESGNIFGRVGELAALQVLQLEAVILDATELIGCAGRCEE